MRRLLVYIFVAAFVLSAVGSASAIDFRTKGAEVSIIKKKDKEKENPPKKPTEPKKIPDKAPQEPKKYDDFVDQNDNGIDDRKENLKKKPAEDDSDKNKDKNKNKEVKPG